jgi:serine protease AprX
VEEHNTAVPGVGWIRRRASLLVLATALVLGLAAPASAAYATSSPRASGPSARFVVRADAGRLSHVLRELKSRGIPVEQSFAALDEAVVRAPASAVYGVARLRGVAAVSPDVTLAASSVSYDPMSDVGSAYNTAQLMDAPDAWASGATGQGVDVALIDTGVTPVGPLADPSTVLNGPDLSFDGQSDSTRYLDLNGHGTFMAGLIAGRATSLDPGAYQGIAPDARIVNVKVGDAIGRADVSQVIAGIDWVVQHAHDNGLNIRIINLSFGTDSTQSYTVDPLAHAAEVAWRSGIVVVASAGNRGGAPIDMPAADPYVIAVGALDTKGTLDPSDDKLAGFSAKGTSARRLDMVAPGARIQGLRVPGSYVDQQLGASGGIDANYLRGSGTSEAAALTSGAAADLLSVRPGLKPDQVKKLLAKGSYLWGVVGTPRTVDVGRAIDATTTTMRQTFTRATGTGSLELSRGGSHVSDGTNQLTGEQDIFGNPYDSAAMAAQRENGGTWDGGNWNGAPWAGDSWSGASWAGASWAGASWAGASWAGASWAGASWAGASWSGASWSGASWAGASWSGASWSGASWSGVSWASTNFE